jgi:hypothetical protein
MTQPIVLTVSSPVAQGQQILVTGTGFGQVSAVALVDNVSAAVFAVPSFYIESTRGLSIRATIPRTIPVGIYYVLLGTLDGYDSVNQAGTTTVVATDVPSYPPEPSFPLAGTTIDAVRTRMRYELGDYSESFDAQLPADGMTRRFELPVEVVDTTTLTVHLQTPDGTTTTLATPADYPINAQQGIVTLTAVPAAGSVLLVQGDAFQFFGNDELDMFINSALSKHLHGSTTRTVVRSPVTGYVTYTTQADDLTSLPVVEVHPLAILATIEALWALAADASFDIDVSTAEGTSLPRHQRYAAIMQMISSQQQRYDELCKQLNVGLGRLEMFTLRRVSKSTGRLVPVYQPQEIDEWGPPIRVFPPVDTGVSGTGSAHRWTTGQFYLPTEG